MPSPRQPNAVTRSSIITSATELIRKHGATNVNVSAIMNHAGISRTAFYRQFSDVHDVMAEILEAATEELVKSAGPWLTDTEVYGSPETIRVALLSFATAFHANGELLGALADASRADDRLHKMWRHGLVAEFNTAVARAIEQDQEAGLIRRDLDPVKTALGLNLMDEGISVELLGRRSNNTPQDFVEIVAPIWIHTLFETVSGDEIAP